MNSLKDKCPQMKYDYSVVFVNSWEVIKKDRQNNFKILLQSTNDFDCSEKMI